MGVWNPGPGATGGNDTFTGDGTNETASGLAGNDTLNANGGNDTLDGGDGDDILNGGDGDDILIIANTLSGNDQFNGGDGFDIIRVSGNGNYSFPFSGGASVSSIERVEFGEDGTTLTSVLVLSTQFGAGFSTSLQIHGSSFIDNFGIQMTTAGAFSAANFVVANWGAGDEFNIYGSTGNDTITGLTAISNRLSGGNGSDTLIGGSSVDTFYGGDGDDIVYATGGDSGLGDAGEDRLNFSQSTLRIHYDLAIDGTQQIGLDGNDVVTVFSGFERLTGTSFNDELLGTDGANQIDGAAGNDAITGRAGNDVLNGGDGDDTIDGGDDHDTLRGGIGNDTLIGGGGNDNYWADAGNDSYSDSAGTDAVHYEESLAAVNVNLATGVGSGGSAQGDTYSGIEHAYGSAFGDTIRGGGEDNYFNGFNGNDTLIGQGGSDQLYGNDGNDTLLGGDGDDFLNGFTGTNTIGGGAGRDYVDYSWFSTQVVVDLNAGTTVAGGTSDTLTSIEAVIGSSAADILSGRDYVDDTLEGGEGDDILMGRYGADGMHGGNGIDTLSYVNSLTAVDVRLFNGFAAGGEANGDTFSGIENIIGSTKTDTLAGDAGANFIRGGSGNETITGREGADILWGEGGNDTLLGGAEDDTLMGGTGNDTLGGGVGNDTADYSLSGSAVTVNLQTGSGSGGDAQGDTLVSIENVLGSLSDDVIIGKNNWDNVLDGGLGFDTLTGGTGNDTFVFRYGEVSTQTSGALDTVTDFSNAGGNNDLIVFYGFGTEAQGASLVQWSADIWEITSSLGDSWYIRFSNMPTIGAGDYVFMPG